jgi:hypothetical protein
VTDPNRNAFGHLVTDPERLDMPGRVDCLRRLAGELQAARSFESRWLGRSLTTWMHRGGDLLDVLGVRPAQGSRTTAQALVERDAHDSALLRLSVAVGGDAKALRMLRGEIPCPALHAELLREAQGGPTSRAAFTRARRRASRHR